MSIEEMKFNKKLLKGFTKEKRKGNLEHAFDRGDAAKRLTRDLDF